MKLYFGNMVLCDVRWSDAKDYSYGDRKNYTDVLEKSKVHSVIIDFAVWL